MSRWPGEESICHCESLVKVYTRVYRRLHLKTVRIPKAGIFGRALARHIIGVEVEAARDDVLCILDQRMQNITASPFSMKQIHTLPLAGC